MPINPPTPGQSFRQALAAERPLQIAGAINAYTARMAEATGFRALYLSGGGLAANSLGLPDLGISTLDDVLTDVRRITAATTLPLLVDIDTGFGSAFNIARTLRSIISAGVAAVHLEDQVSAKRCGHRPGKQLVSSEEMCDRIRAAALRVYQTLRAEGTQQSLIPLMQTRAELYRFLDYHAYEQKLDDLFAQHEEEREER
jgi:methylisocitrate lyase